MDTAASRTATETRFLRAKAARPTAFSAS